MNGLVQMQFWVNVGLMLCFTYLKHICCYKVPRDQTIPYLTLVIAAIIHR